jgi:ATP-dependent DNA helicase PIF1
LYVFFILPGVGFGRDNERTALNFFSKRARLRWESVQTLIIDEISMMSADLFSKIEFLAQHARFDPSRPFGGVQVR